MVHSRRLNSEKAREHADYHLVSRYELARPDNAYNRDFQQRAREEFNRRVRFNRKYYGGRINKPHKHWMGSVGSEIPAWERVNMSLDACIVYSDLKKQGYIK